MKALILKDVYTLWKQVRIFVLLILVFSAVPNSFNNMFAIVYAAMLPYTALAYDERSKWDQMAAMMPYSTRDLVLSKYLLGWFSIAAAALFTAVAQTVIRQFMNVGGIAPSSILMSCSAAIAILSITLPGMFRFGVEKGRLMMILVIALTCGSVGALSSVAENPDVDALEKNLTLILPAAALALTAVSVPLSMRLYRRER